MQDSAEREARSEHKLPRRYRIWTPDDTAWMKRLARGGYACRSIADQMDRDHAQIVRKMREHKILPGVSLLHLAALARCNMRRRVAA